MEVPVYFHTIPSGTDFSSSTLYATSLHVPNGEKYCKVMGIYHDLPMQLYKQITGWMSTPKTQRLEYYLFLTGLHTVDYAQKSVEEKLLAVCSPLTLDQRSPDWFTMRQFRLADTVTTKILVQKNTVPDAFNVFSEPSPMEYTDLERFSSSWKSCVLKSVVRSQ